MSGTGSSLGAAAADVNKLLSRTGPKESASARLARISRLNLDAEDVQDIFQEMQDDDEHALEDITFRHHAYRTQQRENKSHAMYLDFVKLHLQFPPETEHDDEDLQFAAWPDDHDQLIKQIKKFMRMVIPTLQPRSMLDETVGWGVMTKYRSDIMYWCRMIYSARPGATVPPSHMIFNGITQSLRWVAEKHKIRVKRAPKTKTYLGLPELGQLIDLDTRGTPNIAFAEGHHLGWCIFRMTALRPGSIGAPQPAHRDPALPFQHLIFRDVQITRGESPGEFIMDLHIRNLKGSVYKDADSEGHLGRTVHFIIRSPQQAFNLQFSVPVRFLSLALRRGALQHYTTIEELLNGDHHNISIKEEFLDKSVICSGSPRGLDIDLDSPATAKSLTNYIQLRGRLLGYPEDITIYSIRRRAGTDFARVLGTEAARRLMTHEENSRTLQKFYLEEESAAKDIAAVGLHENTDARRDEMRSETHKLALGKLPAKRVTQLYGTELNSLYLQTITNDPIWCAAETDSERKNRERVVRKACLRTLMDQAHIAYKAEMTVQSRTHNKEQIAKRATEFNRRLVEAVKVMANGQSLPDNPDESGIDFEDDFDNVDRGLMSEGEYEPDFDEAMHESDQVDTIEEQTMIPGNMDYTVSLGSVDYRNAVEATMVLLMESGLDIKGRGKALVHCPLCIDDPTVDEERKQKTYKSFHLPGHLKTEYHSPYQFFRRTIIKEQAESGAATIPCQFCTPIVPRGKSAKEYKDVAALIKHITGSNSKKIANNSGWSNAELAEAHEQAKDDFGWDAPGWKGDEDQKKREAEIKTSRRRKSDPARTFSKEKELVAAINHPGNPNIVYGDLEDPNTIYARFANTVDVVPVSEAGGLSLTARLSRAIDVVDVPGEDGLFTEDDLEGVASEVEFGPIPGSKEWRESMR